MGSCEDPHAEGVKEQDWQRELLNYEAGTRLGHSTEIWTE